VDDECLEIDNDGCDYDDSYNDEQLLTIHQVIIIVIVL